MQAAPLHKPCKHTWCQVKFQLTKRKACCHRASLHTKRPLQVDAYNALRHAVDWSVYNSKPPWQASGQGKARRLFEVDQGHSKRVISLARDQTILKLTSAEFKDRLADVLGLLPEWPISGVPPKLLARLVMMPPGDIAKQIVLLSGLFQFQQDMNEVLLAEPTLLTIPFVETALHVDRLKGLLGGPCRVAHPGPYSNAGVDVFLGEHPQLLLHENVVAALQALRIYLGKSLEVQGTIVQDYVSGNPGMLLKGYKYIPYTHNTRRLFADNDNLNCWWVETR